MAPRMLRGHDLNLLSSRDVIATSNFL